MSTSNVPPSVTFVLVTHGHGRLAVGCLDTLARHTSVPYEVVVVDSASPDGTGEWLERNLAGATVFRMPENLGFGAGCELGIRHARTEFVCLLNADVEVTPGWLEPLLDLLRRNPEAAAVAPAMVFPDGRLQEAGSVMGADGLTRGWGDGPGYSEAGYHDAAYGEQLHPCVVDYASAACLLLRRRAFYAAGGFCADYHIAYYEDADLQFALRARGWQLWVQPESRVVHVRHGTSSTDTAERLSAVNREIFRHRWPAELDVRPPAADAPAYPHRLHWLRDGPAPFSVLLLTERVPDDARELAALHAWREAEPAAAVTVLAKVPGGGGGLRALGVEVFSGVDDPAEWSLRRAGRYDVVCAFGVDAHAALRPVVEHQPQAVRVLDLDGLPHEEHERRMSAARGARRRELGVLAGTARRDADAAVAEADVLVCGDAAVASWARAVARGLPCHVASAPDYAAVLDAVLVDCALPPRSAQQWWSAGVRRALAHGPE